MIEQCPMCDPVIYGDHEFTKYRVCARHTRQLERPKTETCWACGHVGDGLEDDTLPRASQTRARCVDRGACAARATYFAKINFLKGPTR